MSLRPALLAGTLGLASAAAACGGGSGGPGATGRARLAASPVPIRTADCAYWKRASGAQRAALLAQLYAFYSGSIGGEGTTPSAPGPTLSADRATKVFGNWCAQPYAGGFKLYKLYGRAAAFTPRG